MVNFGVFRSVQEPYIAYQFRNKQCTLPTVSIYPKSQNYHGSYNFSQRICEDVRDNFRIKLKL